MIKNIYRTQDAETGTVIDTFATLDEATEAISQYENADIADGIFTDEFYQVYNTETEEIVF